MGWRWTGAFENVVVRKHDPPLPSRTKLNDPPLIQGCKLHDPTPIKHDIFGCTMQQSHFLYEIVAFTF